MVCSAPYLEQVLYAVVFVLTRNAANVHDVVCRQKHFELPSSLEDCNITVGGLIVDDYSGVFNLPNLRMAD